MSFTLNAKNSDEVMMICAECKESFVSCLGALTMHSCDICPNCGNKAGKFVRKLHNDGEVTILGDGMPVEKPAEKPVEVKSLKEFVEENERAKEYWGKAAENFCFFRV